MISIDTANQIVKIDRRIKILTEAIESRVFGSGTLLTPKIFRRPLFLGFGGFSIEVSNKQAVKILEEEKNKLEMQLQALREL